MIKRYERIRGGAEHLGSLQISHLTTCAAAAAAASRAAQQEEDLQASASGAVELDEFGRDANMLKRQEAAERRQRRMQRLQQQADKQTGSQVGHSRFLHDSVQAGLAWRVC